MIDLPESTERSDILDVTVRDVEDELGAIVSNNSGVFPEESRERIISNWIKSETRKLEEFAGYKSTFGTEGTEDYYSVYDELTDNDKQIIHDCILFRVCVRVLGRCQGNRKLTPQFSTPTYLEMMKRYEELADSYSLYIRTKYYPETKDRNEEYYPRPPENKYVPE